MGPSMPVWLGRGHPRGGAAAVAWVLCSEGQREEEAPRGFSPSEMRRPQGAFLSSSRHLFVDGSIWCCSFRLEDLPALPSLGPLEISLGKDCSDQRS